jgi:hypothetical protein
VVALAFAGREMFTLLLPILSPKVTPRGQKKRKKRNGIPYLSTFPISALHLALADDPLVGLFLFDCCQQSIEHDLDALHDD